jgi:hypothetical protein
VHSRPGGSTADRWAEKQRCKMKKKNVIIIGTLLISVIIISTCIIFRSTIYLLLLGVPIESSINFENILFTITDEEKAEILIDVITDVNDRDKDITTFPILRNYYVVDKGIPSRTKELIENYFSKYSVNIKWIVNQNDAPISEYGARAVIDGVIIDPSKIQFPGMNRAYLTIYVYQNGLGSSLDVYYLEKKEGKWIIPRDPKNIYVTFQPNPRLEPTRPSARGQGA